MAHTFGLRMNLSALKKLDPYINDILDIGKGVALYTFNSNVKEWKKAKIEGTLFLCKRSGDPEHTIVLLNRLSLTDFINPLTYGFEMKVHQPFLLLRNEKYQMYCFWFESRAECSRISAVVHKLVKKLCKEKDRKSNVAKQRGVHEDISGMLSNAFDKYKARKSDESVQIGTETLASKNRKDEIPKNVMDFIVKARMAFLPDYCGTYETVVPDKDEDAPLRRLLQDLKSNPMYSVQYIENRQRSATPGTKYTDNQF